MMLNVFFQGRLGALFILSSVMLLGYLLRELAFSAERVVSNAALQTSDLEAAALVSRRHREEVCCAVALVICGIKLPREGQDRYWTASCFTMFRLCLEIGSESGFQKCDAENIYCHMTE